MSIVSGNAQKAPVNTNVAAPLRVRVLDHSGRPVPDFVVNFVVTGGGGHVFGGAEQTDAQGYAEEVWTLGPRLGPQTVDVRSVDAHTGQPITYGHFTATGLPPNNVPVVIANGKGIARMNADGTGIVQLTTDPRDSLPDLSPDHTKIAFASARSGTGFAIYLMNADGGHIHPITPVVFSVKGPSFSPDGTMLVFFFDSLPQPNSQNTVRVTDTSGTVVGGWVHSQDEDLGMSWTADGQSIIYATNAFTGNLEIFKSDLRGQTIVQLTEHWIVTATQVSPDDQHVAFIGTPVADARVYKVYLMNLDGSNITPIADADQTGFLSWSPSSQLLGTNRGLMNADGTNLVKINGGSEGRFAWR